MVIMPNKLILRLKHLYRDYEHNTKLGNAHAHELFSSVTAERIDTSRPARTFSDYVVRVRKDIFSTVRIIERL